MLSQIESITGLPVKSLTHCLNRDHDPVGFHNYEKPTQRKY